MPKEAGKEVRGAYPPLSRTPGYPYNGWLSGEPDRAIKIVLNGLYGSQIIDGKAYGDIATGQPAMTGLGQLLSDEEVAAVLTYVRQSFGNDLPVVKAAQVKKVREEIKDKNNAPYTVEEVLKQHPLEAAKAAPAKAAPTPAKKKK